MSTDQDDVRFDYESGCKGLRTGPNVRYKVGGDMLAACCNTNKVLCGAQRISQERSSHKGDVDRCSLLSVFAVCGFGTLMAPQYW